MRLVRSTPLIRIVVVLSLTALTLMLGAILLPPKDSSAMPPDAAQAPVNARH